MLQSQVKTELKELANSIAKEPENLYELYERLQGMRSKNVTPDQVNH